MKKGLKLLVIAASLATMMAISIGGVALAAGAANANIDGLCCGLGTGFGGQGVCSNSTSELLGMTAGEIQDLRQEGKSLVQIAATKNISEQQLVGAIMTDRKTQVQARVTAGTLTQEQANLVLKQMEQNVVRAVNRVTTGRPEWAGANGNGQCAGNGVMRNQGQAGNTGFGKSGLGTGPGNMNKWGRGSR
jgi:hypothetical protein